MFIVRSPVEYGFKIVLNALIPQFTTICVEKLTKIAVFVQNLGQRLGLTFNPRLVRFLFAPNFVLSGVKTLSAL